MFERIKDKISRSDPDTLRANIEREIVLLGDMGVKCALERKSIPTEKAIDTLDTIRLKGERDDHVFVSTLASRQIDRIREAKDW